MTVVAHEDEARTVPASAPAASIKPSLPDGSGVRDGGQEVSSSESIGNIADGNSADETVVDEKRPAEGGDSKDNREVLGESTALPSSGSRLCQQRNDELDKAGMNVSWEDRFEQLVAYKEELGDCKVPQSSGPLGKWVANQRVEYHKKHRGEKTYLSDQREKRLNGIGFTWQCHVRHNKTGKNRIVGG